MTLESPVSDDPLSDRALRERFARPAKEIRMVRLLVEGRANAEIASRLLLSPHTVRRHTERIFSKLGVRSRAEIAARVLRAGARAGRGSTGRFGDLPHAR